jgi:hypothetical protein
MRPISKIPTGAAILYVAVAVLIMTYVGLVMPYAGPTQGGVEGIKAFNIAAGTAVFTLEPAK